MKDELKNIPTTPTVEKELVQAHAKASYSTPALQVYGSVGKLTQGSGGVVTEALMMASDPRAKEHIVRIGTHPLGIGLYLFDYLPEHREAWGHGRQFGVMADEVEAVMPEAVSMFADGYKRVNYTMLGVSHPIH
jgi:hypothetical protein